MNYVKTFALMLGLMVLFVSVGQRLGGTQGAVIAFVVAAAMNVAAYWHSDTAVIAMHRAREVSAREAPDLYRSVQRLSGAAGIPMPRVYVFEDDAPNAFATGRNLEHAAVACSTGILEILGPAELEGVLAHELSHIKHRDMLISTMAATMAGAIMMLASMARWAMLFGGLGGGRDDDRRGNPFAFLLALVLAPLAATVVQLMISRSREFAADEGAAALTGHPRSLIRALQKIHSAHEEIPQATAQPAMAHLYIANPFAGGLLAGLFSTHPTLEARVARLEAIESGRINPVF